MEKYAVTGMSCAACQARVEKAVSKVPGVESCSVSLLTNTMGVTGEASAADIIQAVTDAGYGASLQEAEGDAAKGNSLAKLAQQEEALKDHETPRLRKRLIASVVFLVILMYFSMGHMMLGWPVPGFMEGNHVSMGLLQLLLSAIIMVINQKFFISGYKSLFHGAPNMDTLIALGASAAFGYSTVMLFAMTSAQADGNMAAVEQYMMEFYFESAAMILTLITVGKMLEAYSKGKTTNALKSLMQLSPKTANVLREGAEVTVSIDDVRRGDLFVVRPGENIPVDGIVIEGSSAVNEAALTGESIPVDKAAGDEVTSATLNQSGFLKCEAIRVGEDTTLSQIIRMVSDAAATKAPVAKLADKISAVFVPVVIALAVITIVVWLILGQPAGSALARGICVLVVSCPCALGLATPVAIMVGNGMGAKNGILFKNAEAMQEAGNVQIVALDKTGTITRGEPEVTDIVPADDVSEEALLRNAISIEKKSEHPLAKAILQYAEEQGYEGEDVDDFRALPGNGLTAVLKGAVLTGGNEDFIQSRAEIPDGIRQQAGLLSEDGKTPLFFARVGCQAAAELARADIWHPGRQRAEASWPEPGDRVGGSSPTRSKDGKLLGLIAVADTMKEDSRKAINQLQNLGIHVVMLTGDNPRTARAVGRAAGVNEVIAGVRPDGKESVIRRLQTYGKVAMVGDGINDAPALTRADIGIAIGAGADVAIDAADIVLMKSSLKDVAAAVRLSRRTYRNIIENLFWALIYNVLLIPAAAGVYASLGITMNPMLGAAAMSLSSFCVVMNALRLNLMKVKDPKHDRPKKNGLHLPEGGKLLEESIGDEEPVTANRPEKAGAETGHTKDTKTAISDTERGNSMEKTMKIEGMMCGHCEARVKKALEALEQVEEAVVSHEEGTAVLKLNREVDDAVLTKAVEEQDYKVLEIV